MTPTSWLKDFALPLWTTKGLHPVNGFEEAMTLNGAPYPSPQRCMVQARQIYAVRTALQMGLVSQADAVTWSQRACEFMLKSYSQPTGEFLRFPQGAKNVASNPADLYTQAFAIFGLAQAFALHKDEKLKKRAQQVVQYLKQKRALPHGGYSEVGADGAILYQSNPHMHLFEAYIAWMEVDDDPNWRRHAQEILDLCLTAFIDKRTGLLAEHFTEGWKPVLHEDRFVVEPGHQYEWAWLMNKYRENTKAVLPDHLEGLVMSSENFGISPETSGVYDEIWSDLSVKTATHRFWPQCERIKACSALGLPASAQEAMTVLMKFFETPTKGVWFDRMNPDQSFHHEPARASSLYHIIGAISEFELRANGATSGNHPQGSAQ